MADQGAAAFAALESIQAGDWDRFLLRLRAAIDVRRGTKDYRDGLVAGASTPDEVNDLLLAGAPKWLRDLYDEIDRLRAALAASAPDEVNASPYTDDNGDLNAEGEVYLQRAARRIHAASAPDEVNDGETE